MITRILVGTTGASQPDPAVEAAAELARSHEAELVVLELEPLLDARRVFDPDGVRRAGSPVTPLHRTYPDLRVRTRRARGNAATTVCTVAKQEAADLIVVPHGRPQGEVALLTRRASKALVSRAPCPVLLVAS